MKKLNVNYEFFEINIKYDLLCHTLKSSHLTWINISNMITTHYLSPRNDIIILFYYLEKNIM